MRLHRLLNDRGSAVTGSIFGIVFVMMLVLGVVQVGLTLYARNVVAAAAHEGARAAIERGRAAHEAGAIARAVVDDSAGGIVRDLHVDPSFSTVGERHVVSVRVSGRLVPFGLLPVSLGIERTASLSRPQEVAP